MKLRAITSLIALAPLALVGVVPTPAQAQLPQLILKLRRAVSLPPGESPDGGLITPSGTIVVWRRSAPGLLRTVGPSAWERTGASIAEPIGAFASADGTITGFDAKRKVVAIGADGTAELRDLSHIPELSRGKLLEAVHSPDGWLVTVRLDSARYDMVRVPDEIDTASIQLSINGDHPSQRSPYSLSAIDLGSVISERGFPFESILLTTRDRATKVFVKPISAPRLASLLHSEANAWLAMPLLQLDSGYLQVFANTRSDRRMIVVYAPDGAVARIASTNAPIGLFGSSVERRGIIGLVTVDRSDTGQFQSTVEEFSWSWTTETPGEGVASPLSPEILKRDSRL